MIFNRLEQYRGGKQASCFGRMVIRECLNIGSKLDKPRIVPIELDKIDTGTPDAPRYHIDGYGNVEQTLDIHILRYDPSRFFEARVTSSDNRLRQRFLVERRSGYEIGSLGER